MAISCHFARVALFELSKRFGNKAGKLDEEAKSRRLDAYKTLFAEFPSMDLLSENTSSKLIYKLNQTIQRLMGMFRRRGWNKEGYVKSFSAAAWEKKDLMEKGCHTLKDCHACKVQFPEWDNQFPHGRFRLTAARKSSEKMPDSMALIVAEECWNDAETSFSSRTSRNILDVLDLPESNLPIIKQPTKSEKQKQCTETRRRVKKSIENSLQQGDVHRVLSGRESLNHFEKVTRDELLVTPQHRPPQKTRHSPIAVSYDINAVKAELQSLSAGSRVNWEALGRKYQLTYKNAGQVLKEHLKEQGFPVHLYGNSLVRTCNAEYRRRVKKRLIGGKVTMPRHLTKRQIRFNIKRQIESGELDVGEAVAVHPVKRIGLSTDGKISETTELVDGRRIKLENIRIKMLKQEEELGLARFLHKDWQNCSRDEVLKALDNAGHELHANVEEISMESLCMELQRIQTHRHLKMWSDGSTLENHGYILFCVSRIFDSGYYFTNAEYSANTGRKLDVESLVEQPEIYILAKCSAKAEDLKLFSESRIQDLQELSAPVFSNNGTPINDKLRFFHGDNSSLWSELSLTHGGEYCCPACTASSLRFNDIEYINRAALRTMSSICATALQSKNSSTPGIVKPLRTLSKKELQEEAEDRELESVSTVQELRDDIKEARCGVESVPVLLLNNPTERLDKLNLHHVEIPGCEPLHASKGHIDNLFSELRKCLPALQTYLSARFDGKNMLRARDYREALQHLPAYLHQHNCDDNIIELFDSLQNIIHILYSSPSKRSTTSVLRLYNQVLIHILRLREICPQPKVITSRKLWGLYLHALHKHAPILNRIVSPRSVNTEEEEAEFNACRMICRLTSNHKNSTIVPNIIMRRQAEVSRRGDQQFNVASDVEHISHFEQQGSVFPREWLLKYSRIIQSHLEQISDFLLPGPGVWWQWTECGDVQFNDVPGSKEPTLPNLKCFREANICSVQTQLKDDWNQILEANTEIPALKIRLFKKNGDLMKLVHGNCAYPENKTTTQARQQDAEEVNNADVGQSVEAVDPTTSTIVDPQNESQVLSVEAFVPGVAGEEVQVSQDVVMEESVADVACSESSLYQSDFAEVQMSCGDDFRASFKSACTTKTGQCLATLLGYSESVLACDRYKLKARETSGSQQKFYAQKYEETLEHLKPQVLRVENSLKLSNNCNDQRKLKMARALLKSWNWYFW